MADPVVALDGRTYDRAQIEAHFAAHGPVSPLGFRLEGPALVPNLAVRALVERRHPRLVLAPIRLPGHPACGEGPAGPAGSA